MCELTAVTTTITSTVVSTREYDTVNRLISVTTDGQVRTMEWSDAGELLRNGDDTYRWDAAGRLVSATVDGVANHYLYLGGAEGLIWKWREHRHSGRCSHIIGGSYRR